MDRNLAKENPYMRMVVNILRTGNIIDKKVSEVLKKFEITHIQFNILRILEVAYPNYLSVGEINSELFFSTSDVTRLLDRLEKKELITRVICPKNRRKMDISLTEKGHNLIVESLPEIENKLDGFYKEIVSPEERNLVIDIMGRLKGAKNKNLQ
ncbi:MAG: MarR family transcriptional regulator [Bacteroidales bacterium]|nr:MarR family transcriptional regulator [Bacteroidales bacterium]